MMMIRLHSWIISFISYESMTHEGSVDLLATLHDSELVANPQTTPDHAW